MSRRHSAWPNRRLGIDSLPINGRGQRLGELPDRRGKSSCYQHLKHEPGINQEKKKFSYTYLPKKVPEMWEWWTIPCYGRAPRSPLPQFSDNELEIWVSWAESSRRRAAGVRSEGKRPKKRDRTCLLAATATSGRTPPFLRYWNAGNHRNALPTCSGENSFFYDVLV